MMKPACFLYCLVVVVILSRGVAMAETATKEISSLAELAAVAGQSGQVVRMKPGVYRLTDLVPLESVPERRKQKAWQYLTFSGSGNTFDLTGVTVELDTAVRGTLRAPIHTDEFLISGSNVTLKGLTITSKGDGKALGGAVLGITGTGVTLRDCTIHVGGSAPYGYGDLFGKGGFKHSGVHITGSGARILGCKVFTKAFGHAFYLQEDCNDVRLENCHAEGVMRRTDEVLAESKGLAFEKNFQMLMKSRRGDARILPGYMKALSEDGFRTYGTHQNLVLKNCTAKNMRGGFELRTRSAPRLENCTAVGCERGFWVSDGAVVTGCRGDAAYGPLLYVEGAGAVVDVRLLPAEDKGVTVHALAALYGRGNRVTITEKGRRTHALPILVGYGPPGMGENMSPYPEQRCTGLSLRNESSMPVVIGAKAMQCQIDTRGPVKENLGKNVTVVQRTQP